MEELSKIHIYMSSIFIRNIYVTGAMWLFSWSHSALGVEKMDLKKKMGKANLFSIFLKMQMKGFSCSTL